MSEPISGRPIVLIVEDEPLVREIIVIELEEAGFEVLEAQTGEEAADAIERGTRIDLLFTDLRLPGALDGWDVAERARRRDAAMPVIYATGYSQGDERRVPGSVFLTKPYRIAAVLDAAQTLGVKGV
ncbi:MAG TPA: response regulator [Beijerinckiaceae bacterium]|nr:response regulator [Beijerinckiaceae bacterium]